MPASASRPADFRRRALWCVLASAFGLFACMEAGSPVADAQSAGEASGAQTSQETPQDKKAAHPGVPDGCTRRWSSAQGDSVLYCPDLPPPSPR